MPDHNEEPTLQIDDADLEIVLDDYEAWREAPTLNDYFCSAAYTQPTELERETALINMRRAWVEALVGAGLKRTHARGYVHRQEFYVRETMNTVDALPVTPMAWNPHWPAAE